MHRKLRKLKKINVPYEKITYFNKSGYNGSYLKTSPKKGIKFIDHPLLPEDLNNAEYFSHILDDIKKEFLCLKLAHSRAKDNVPKPLNLVLIKTLDEEEDLECYYIGYEMSHINGSHLKGKYTSRNNRKTVNELFVKLAKKGVFHLDLHSENILKHGNRLYAIDFDPRFIRFEYMPAKYGGMEEFDGYGNF